MMFANDNKQCKKYAIGCQTRETTQKTEYRFENPTTNGQLIPRPSEEILDLYFRFSISMLTHTQI